MAPIGVFEGGARLPCPPPLPRPMQPRCPFCTTNSTKAIKAMKGVCCLPQHKYYSVKAALVHRHDVLLYTAAARCKQKLQSQQLISTATTV